MGSIQIHNAERDALQIPDRQAYEHYHEPLGDFGVYNGQFEQGPDGRYPGAEGWNLLPDPSGTVDRVASGLAGNYRIRGGRAGLGTGGDIESWKYLPVDEDYDYSLSASFIGTVNARVRMGLHCYDATKALVGTIFPLGNTVPGVVWVRYEFNVGPGGTAFVANTRYIRIVIELQNDGAQTGEFAYVDDVHFKWAFSGGLPIAGHWTRVGNDLYPTNINDEIGLGIALPLTHLHLYEDTASIVPAVRIEQDGAGDAALNFLLTGGQSWSMGIDNSINDAFVIAGGANLQTNPYLTILVGGNIGINDVVPGHTLDVDGDIDIHAGSGLMINDAAANRAVLIGDGTRGVFRALVAADLPVAGSHWTRDAGNAELYPTNIDDQIGMGISDPITHLHLYEDTASITPAVLIEQDGAGDAALNFLLTGGQNWSIGIDNSLANDPLIIAAGADLATNPYLTILPTGDIGIGVTSPDTLLHLLKSNAELRIETADATDPTLSFKTTNTAHQIDIGLDENAAIDVLNIAGVLYVEDTNNRVGIGIAVPTAELGVNGRAYFGADFPGSMVNIEQSIAGSAFVRALRFVPTLTSLAGHFASFLHHLTITGSFTQVSTVGIQVDNLVIGGGASATNMIGITVANQTTATNNTNLLLGASVSPAGDFSIYSPSSYDSYFAGDVGIGIAAPLAKLHIFQSDNAAAIPAVEISQADQSEGLINFVGNLAASAVGPLSSWTTGNAVQGHARVEINGTQRWIRYYDDPAS